MPKGHPIAISGFSQWSHVHDKSKVMGQNSDDFSTAAMLSELDL